MLWRDRACAGEVTGAASDAPANFSGVVKSVLDDGPVGGMVISVVENPVPPRGNDAPKADVMGPIRSIVSGGRFSGAIGAMPSDGLRKVSAVPLPDTERDGQTGVLAAPFGAKGFNGPGQAKACRSKTSVTSAATFGADEGGTATTGVRCLPRTCGSLATSDGGGGGAVTATTSAELALVLCGLGTAVEGGVMPTSSCVAETAGPDEPLGEAAGTSGLLAPGAGADGPVAGEPFVFARTVGDKAGLAGVATAGDAAA